MTDMTCDEARDLLTPHVDAALSRDERALVEAHLETCPACRARHDDLVTLRRRIAKAGPHPLPPDLAARIDRALDAQSMPRPVSPASSRWQTFTALAASHLLVAALSAGLLFTLMSTTRREDDVLREVVNAHVRATLANQLVQVASSDTHTVKPWLAARLPFSPDVRDYKADGFPLIGARLDYLLDRPVASLVYARRQHTITVIVVPADQAPAQALPRSARHGFNVASWRDAEFVYFAASDVNGADLQQFIDLASRRG